MSSDFNVIKAFWMELLYKYEKTESEELLKVLKFVDKEVARLNANHAK